MGAITLALPLVLQLVKAGLTAFSEIKAAMDARKLRVQDETGADLTVEQLKVHYDAFVAEADEASKNAASRIDGRT